MNAFLIIVVAVDVALLTLYGYVFRTYARRWSGVRSVPTEHRERVQVVVVFRNEAEHLPALINHINELSYDPDLLNVLFVDDHSTDGSADRIREGMKRYAYQILTAVGEGKKAGLRQAWRQLGSGLVLQTDADCILPTDWVQHMVAPFADPDVRFVSGPVVYPQGKTAFERWVQLDFATLVAVGGAHIAWKHPMICNGANLCFRLDLESLDLNDDVASGDDVFLMQDIARRHPDSVRFVKLPQARVITMPPLNLPAFLQQRLRWASKNTRYTDPLNKAVLTLTWIFNLLLLIQFLMPIAILRHTALFMLVCKLLVENRFLERIQPDLPLGNWHGTHILGQLAHIPYIALMPILSTFVPYRWKERRQR